MNSINSMNRAWNTLCPPAQIFPIVLIGILLFDLYRGAYKSALSHTATAIIGTGLLWVLCAAGLDFVAYALLIMPLLFFVFFLAIVFYDKSSLNINHKHQNSCKKPNHTCS